MNTKKRLATAFAATVIAPTVALLATAQPAAAAVCPGDFCAQFTYINGNVATVQIQTVNGGFTGHYELQMPNHGVKNTSDTYWYTGRTVNLTENGGVGNWCITAWIWYGGNDYQKSSYACISD